MPRNKGEGSGSSDKNDRNHAQAGTRYAVDRERYRALCALLNFMVREELTYPAAVIAGVKELLHEKHKELLLAKDEEKITFTGDDFQNFVRGQSAKCYSEVFEVTQNIASQKILKIPMYMNSLVRYCFPDFADFSPVQMGNADSIFLQNAATDERTKQRIQRSYSGVFDVYRYSAHIYYDADVKDKGKSPDDIDAVIVRAQMQIYDYEPDENFPRFRMYYQPNQQKHYNQIFEINGIVVPIKNLLYLIGFERNYGYPIVIVSIVEETEPIDMFMGMVMRYSEKIICSRVGFRRSPHKNLDAAKSVATVLKESEVQAAIECFGRSLINEVKHKGKSALVL